MPESKEPVILSPEKIPQHADDTDVLVEYIQKQSKHSKNSVVYVYDRNGNEVYKSMKF